MKKSKFKISGIVDYLNKSIEFTQTLNDYVKFDTIIFKENDEWDSIELIDGRVFDIHFHYVETGYLSIQLYQVIDNEINYNVQLKVNFKKVPIKIFS